MVQPKPRSTIENRIEKRVGSGPFALPLLMIGGVILVIVVGIWFVFIKPDWDKGIYP